MRLRIVLVVVAVLSGTLRATAVPPGQVQIRNNVYAPADIRVAHGKSVRWTLAEGRHTVTSDVKRFDSGEMNSVGGTFGFTAPHQDVTIYYHCRIHGLAGNGSDFGSGMVGRIIVGAGSPERRVDSDVELRRVPSRAWPSLDRSLVGLKPTRRYRIELAKGRYGSRDITPASLGFRGQPTPRFDLTLRGAGARPTDVVFEGAATGLGVSVDGLHVENMSFRKQRFAALVVRDVDRWSVDDVAVTMPGRYGVLVDNAYQGRIRRTSISGATVAGISVGGCGDCDLLVDSVNVSKTLQGLSSHEAGTIVVRGSTFTKNGVGIALKGHRGAHVLVNAFRENAVRGMEAPPFSPEKDLPVGAGVWIDGGGFVVVERNEFTGHSFGIVLTGPSMSSRILSNTLTKSAEADIAWDGLGAGVCFRKNVSPSSEAVTSMPPEAEQLYSCDLPATLGVPYPLVTASVLAWGLGLSG